MENKYLMLVNSDNKFVDNNYFEIVDTIFDNIKLEKETYEAFLKLQSYLKLKGYTILIDSGYRSVRYQQDVFNYVLKEKGYDYALRHTATPGYSEHHTALAIDFMILENEKYLTDYALLGHRALEIINDVCADFGFIVRYPKGKENITNYDYEPWHLRFVKDVFIATYIMKNNLCLEEYLLKENVLKM